jgi:hypothetical protein
MIVPFLRFAKLRRTYNARALLASGTLLQPQNHKSLLTSRRKMLRYACRGTG